MRIADLPVPVGPVTRALHESYRGAMDELLREKNVLSTFVCFLKTFWSTNLTRPSFSFCAGRAHAAYNAQHTNTNTRV
eukprot:7386808-Prymnesium_polylepis.1